MSRTVKSIRNIKFAVVGQIFGLLLSFLTRMVFVRVLNAEYLGVNSLFDNIISILSLAELGIGTSIVFSLYKPLSENNQHKVLVLMKLFRKAYFIIGVVVAVLGTALTPFLHLLIKEMPDIPEIRIIYLMFVLNSVISYFYSYKRLLIIADQNGYVDSLAKYTFMSGLRVAQIVFLLLTHNYIVYAGLMIISTFGENLYISWWANKLYPFLKEKTTDKLEVEEKNTIVKNVKAMIFHKLGTVVVLGTDSLLLSKLVSVVSLGLYSNYLVINNALNAIFGLVFQASIASVGNLGATESKEKGKFIFDKIDFLGFWLFGFAAVCLVTLSNHFITIWLSKDYLFAMSVVLAIVLNFYLTGRRKSVCTFKDAYGLYWPDRYKALFESVINLVASFILAKKFGAIGIFLGTSISTLTTCFWVEPKVLFKYGLKYPVRPYFTRYALQTLLVIATTGLTWFVCSFVTNPGITGFIIKVLICAILPNAIFLLAYFRSAEFKYFYDIIIQRIPIFKPK